MGFTGGTRQCFRLHVFFLFVCFFLHLNQLYYQAGTQQNVTKVKGVNSF